MQSTLPDLLDDWPEQEWDRLWRGLREFADQLSKNLPTFAERSPVLLSGDWGSGKTTLLKAVENRLRERGLATVWFDAWRYEGESALLPALMRTVWDAAEELHKNERALSLFKTAWRCALAVGLRATPILATAAGLPVLSSMFSGWGARNIDGDLNAIEAGESLEPQRDPTQELWNSFSKIIEQGWPDQRVVILIDDLDRCSPAGAVALLDGIRTLIVGAEGKVPCHFIAAMDRKVLAEAVANKFAGIGRYDGNRYLEKVFPISFDLPVLRGRDVGKLLAVFLDTRSSADRVHDAAGQRGTSGDYESVLNQQDALSEALSEPMFANPRLMKRCINRFRLVIRFENQADIDKQADSASRPQIGRDRTLAKWIAASERWPILRRLIRAHDEDYWEQVAVAFADPTERMPDADARALLDEEGAKS